MQKIYYYSVEIKEGKVIKATLEVGNIFVKTDMQWVYEIGGWYFTTLHTDIITKKPYGVSSYYHDGVFRFHYTTEEKNKENEDKIIEAIKKQYGQNFKIKLNWEVIE